MELSPIYNLRNFLNIDLFMIQIIEMEITCIPVDAQELGKNFKLKQLSKYDTELYQVKEEECNHL